MYTISEMAARHQTSIRSLRFYEQKGLLSPVRDGEQRLYSDADDHRVACIRLWARAGIRLEEVRRLLELKDGSADSVAAALREMLPGLEAAALDKMAAVTQLRSSLPVT